MFQLNLKKTVFLKKFIMVSILIIFVNGCGTVFVKHRPIPPKHAKAYGHYKKLIFYYYPELGIYWDCELKSYTQYKDGVWIVMNTRPAVLTSSYSYVVIKTDTQKPWLNHSHYKNKYPPGKNKMKGK